MKRFRFLFDYILMMIGCASLSCGIVMFLAPSQIAAGGPPGLAILGHYSLGISTGLLLFIINLPLVLAGYKLLGRKLFIRSLVVVMLTALFTHFLPILFELPDLGDNRLLNALYGGLMMGLGIGLMFKAGSTVFPFQKSASIRSDFQKRLSKKLSMSKKSCASRLPKGRFLNFTSVILQGVNYTLLDQNF